MSRDKDSRIHVFKGPTGRKLDQVAGDPDHIGTVSRLRTATKDLVKVLRKHIREIAVADLERRGKVWAERSTGDEFDLVTSWVDPIDPSTSNVTAFAQRGGYVLYLRPAGMGEESKTVTLGAVGGERV